MSPLPNDADIRFRASLQDDLTPNLERLEKKLKEMGATPREIKMFLKAYDEATPKIKEARKMMDKLPKEHKFHFHADTSRVEESIQKLRNKTREPIRLTFVDNLQERLGQLTSIRAKVPIPMAGAVPGSSMLYAGGALAAGAGGVTALTGVVQKGIQVNSQMEQSMITLQQTLKDHTKATQEMGKIVDVAQKTPFQYQDVLAADVRLRSYAIPTMKGEGGPGNQGWLKSAGDMAAAMNTPITQAVEAIADARQGYFIRMMSYGIRMMREDFQAGGKYAGMTFEQGLAQAIKRFEGAQEAQSKTFQGLTSNIKDILQQQVIKPIGAPAFVALKQGAQTLQDKMQDPQFQLELGRQIQKVQEAFVSLFQQVRKGKQYFTDNLQQPLMEFGKQVAQIGGTFVKTFGGVFIEVLSTVAKLISSLVKPLVAFVSEHPRLVQIYAVFKALSILGFKGPADGLSKIGDALNPLHPSIFKLIGGFKDLTSGGIKVGLAAIVAGFVNAHAASENLERSMKKAGHSSVQEFRALNAEIAKASGGLDMTSNKLSGLTNNALNNLEGGGPTVALAQAKSAAALQRDYGIDAGKANDMMSQMNIKSADDVKKAAIQIRALDSAAKKLEMSFGEVSRVMTMFASQAKDIGLGGPAGGPYLAAINKAVNRKGFLTEDDTGRGIYSGDEFQRQLMEAYKNPSAEAVTAMGKRGKGLSDFYQMSQQDYRTLVGARNQSSMNREGLLGGAGTPASGTSTNLDIIRDTRNRYITNIRAEDESKAGFNRLLSQTGVHAGGVLNAQDLQTPSLVNRQAPGTVPDIDKLVNSSKNAAGAVKALTAAIQENEDTLSNTQNSIDTYNQKINELNKVINATSVRQQVLSMATEKIQHSFVKTQQTIEDMQLAMQKTTFNVMRPMERQSARLSQEMAELGNQSQNAQYNMEKFSTGLLTGEQAALNQLHALERYNRQLEIMQMTYQQIGASLGTTVYDRGITSRVNPLMGLSMEMQMERLQRKQQLANLKYQDTYGEQHYELDQAARSENQRTERSFEDRKKGIEDNVKIIDHVRRAQHTLSNTQFELSRRMFQANEKLQDQQDRVTKLSIALQDKQLHSGLREIQEAQYRLGRDAGKANIELTRQNTLLADAQEKLNDYRTVGERLGKERDKLLHFGGDPSKAANRLIAFGEAAGFIKPDQARAIQQQLDKATGAVKAAGGSPINDKGDMIDAIKQGIRGAFTGDLWRRFNSIRNDLRGINPIGGTTGTIVAGVLTFLTAGAGIAVMTGMVTTLFRQTAIRALTGSLLRNLPAGGRAAGVVGGVREWALGRGFIREMLGNFNLRRRGRQLAGRGIVSAVAPGPLRPIAGMYAESLLEKNTFGDIARRQARYPGVDIFPGGASVQNKMDKTAEKFREASNKVFRGGDSISLGSRRHVAASRVYADSVEKEKDNVFKNAEATKDQKRAAGRQSRAANRALKTAEKMREDLIGHRRGLARVVSRFGGRVGVFAGAITLFHESIGGFAKWAEAHLPGIKDDKKPHVPGREGDRRGPRSPVAAPDHQHKTTSAERRYWREEDAKAAKKAEELAKESPKFRHLIEEAHKAGKDHLVFAGRALRFAGRWGARGVAGLSFAGAGQEAIKGHWGKAALQAANAASYLIPMVGGTHMTLDALEAMGILTNRNNTPAQVRAKNQRFGEQTAAGLKYQIPSQQIRQITGSQEFAKWRYDPDNRDALEGKNQNELLRAYKRYLEQNLDAEYKSHKVSKDEYKLYKEQLKDLQKKYGDSQADDEITRQRKSLDAVRKYHDDHNKLTSTSLSEAYKITDEHLRKLHHRINSTKRSLDSAYDDAPASDSAPDDSPAGPAPGGGTSNDAHRSRQPGAANGLLGKHMLKGRGDNKGYLIRVGEEDDEMIIPLAAHRRDRAKSLIKQAQGLVGFANGGQPTAQISAADKKTQRSAMALLRKAWKFTAPLFRQSPNSKMPNIGFNFSDEFDKEKAGDTITQDFGWGTSHINLSKGTAEQLKDRFPEGVSTALHEWAHYFQKGLKNNLTLAEGGAELFTVKHLKPLLRKMKFDSFEIKNWTSGVYKNQQTEAAKMGDHWLNSTQFGFANGGQILPGKGHDNAYDAAKAVYISAARGIPAFAKGGRIVAIPGQPGESINSRILPDLLQILKKYHAHVTDGYAPTGHEAGGEHPLGLAVDLTPGSGGSWKMLDALARAAGWRPHQPMPAGGPFRWIGWNTESGHGSGNHLHLSWKHDGQDGIPTGIDLPGGTGIPSLAGVHLPKVPKRLKKHGIIGRMIYKALQKNRSHLRASASRATDYPAGLPTSGGGSNRANQNLARRMAAAFGWKGDEWKALYNIWSRESGFDHRVHYGGGHGYVPGLAYGIPQSLPGDKMHTAGADWKTNPATQIKWGLSYIKDRYGDPLHAWQFWQANKSYASGGKLKVTRPEELIRVHHGEEVSVDHPAKASAAKHDPNERRKRQLFDTVEEIKDKIKETAAHLKTVKDKAEKGKDVDHLAELNRALRAQYNKQDQHPARVAQSIKTTIFNEGDTTGGMGTQALVAREKGQWDKERKLAVTHIIKTPEYKHAVTAAHHEEARAKRVVSYAHGAHSPGGKRVTKLEGRAIRASAKASRSARAVPTAMKRTAALKRYLPGAVKRGVDPRLIKDITGHALKGRTKAAYQKAVKAKPGSAQTKAIAALKRALSSDLKSVKNQASRDHKAASAAIRKAFGPHGAKIINAVHKTGSKTASEVKKGHPHAKAAAHHAKATASKVDKHGVAHTAVAKQARDETKKVKESTKDSDNKRSKAEIASDKRERDYQKKSLEHLERISKHIPQIEVNVHNEAHGGATLNTNVTTTKRRRSK